MTIAQSVVIRDRRRPRKIIREKPILTWRIRLFLHYQVSLSNAISFAIDSNRDIFTGMEDVSQFSKQSQNATTFTDTPSLSSSNETGLQCQRGENRLADVVKGTVKSKTYSSKESSSAGDNDSSRTTSPQLAHIDDGTKCIPVAGSTECKALVVENEENSLARTPPPSPEKWVIISLTLQQMSIFSYNIPMTLIMHEIILWFEIDIK